jgi:GT2 family glycosyltransferase
MPGSPTALSEARDEAEAPEQRSVAVVIVSFNSWQFLQGCLESLSRADRGGGPIEVVVVDNASTDGTRENLRSCGHPGLRLIENETNAGFAAAANAGIRATQSDYILLLNPDTVVSATVIGAMVAFMEEHPEAGIASPKLVLQDGRIDPGCHRGFPTPWASFTYMAGLEKLFPRNRLFNGYHRWHLPLDATHEVDAVSGAFMLMRRSMLDEIGLMDERFWMYTEDVDLCLRAREAGYRVYYHPCETVLHVKGTSTGIKRHSDRISRADFATRSRALNAFYDSTKAFFDKHYARRYPKPLTWLVHGVVEGARPVANHRLRRRMERVRRARR